MSKKPILIIVSLILIVSGGFIALDFITIFEANNLSNILSLVLKGVIVLLTALIAFLINKHGLSNRDTILVKLIFVLIIFADLSLLIFKKPYVGIIIFFLTQCVLIYRNTSYIYIRYSFRKIFDIYGIFFTVALMIPLILYLILISKHTTDSFLLILFLFYGIIKSISVLTAIFSFRFKIFPKINRLLLLIGVICFYLCDLNVGLALTLNKSLIQNISNLLIWIFYTPALTLLAVSGYDFDKIRNHYI